MEPSTRLLQRAIRTRGASSVPRRLLNIVATKSGTNFRKVASKSSGDTKLTSRSSCTDSLPNIVIGSKGGSTVVLLCVNSAGASPENAMSESIFCYDHTNLCQRRYRPIPYAFLQWALRQCRRNLFYLDVVRMYRVGRQVEK